MKMTTVPGEDLCKLFEKINTIKEPVELCFAPGRYETAETIKIERNDLLITGEKGKVTITGSKRIPLDKYAKKENIIEIDLTEYGINDPGQFGLGPFEDFWNVYDIPKPHMTEFGPGLEAFYKGKKMQIARYPEEGYMHIGKALGKTPQYLNDGIKNGAEEGIFTADDEAVKTWEDVSEILLIGHWNYDWATQRHTVKSVDKETGAITVDEPYHCYGYRDGPSFFEKEPAKFYAVNVKNALNKPGQWFINRKNKKLYIYPYEGQEYVDVSCAEDLFFIDSHKNIKISGIELANARRSGIAANNCDNIEISDVCAHDLGAWGILCDNCTHTIVSGCHVFDQGGGGIGVNGGDRQTLTSSQNSVKNCRIHNIGLWHRTYMPGIDITGVGCTVSENLIYDVPSFAVSFSGNYHIIEKNEIYNACTESNDAGAIYSGRNWTFRGNIIRYNYLHDISGFKGWGCVGLYFDDAVSSAEVYGNIFANIFNIGIELGGGRDFYIHNNSFYNCKMAVQYDMRETNVKSNHLKRLEERLAEVDYRSDIWKKAFPKLYTIKENDPPMPLGNVICDNIIVGGDGFALSDKKLSDITDFSGNVFARQDCESEHDVYHKSGWHYINK